MRWASVSDQATGAEMIAPTSSKSIWALGERTIETEGKSCRDKKAEATVTGGKSHHGVRRGHYVIFFIRRG